MNLELKTKIEELIAAYQGTRSVALGDMHNLIDQWKDQVNKYQPDHIHEQMKSGMASIQQNVNKVSLAYNQKLNALIEDAKQKAMPLFVTEFQKPVDYETQISNALRYLDIEGEDITDEGAYLILKRFMDDHDQMQLFKNIIKKRVEAKGGRMEDANGNSTFPKTFGKLHQVNTILDTFNEMESIAENLFIYKQSDGETFIINGHRYSLPMESYDELQGEENILDLADIAESIVAKVDGVDHSTDQTEHAQA